MRKHKHMCVNGVMVDRGMASLLKSLWAKGYKTNCSCQSGWGGLVWLGFTTKKDALKFVGLLLKEVEIFFKQYKCYGLYVRRCGDTYSVHFPQHLKKTAMKALKS